MATTAHLDKHTKTTSTPSDTAFIRHQSRSKAMKLQDTARDWLPGERVCWCGRRPAYDGGRKRAKRLLSVKRSQEGVAYYANLERCGSVWTCPVCSKRISNHRREQLWKAGSTWRSRGFHVYLLTLTLPHSREDKPFDLTDKLLAAYNEMTSGRTRLAAALKSYGYAGQVRALEVTVGDANGWHPHLHILLFVKKRLPGTRSEHGRSTHVTGAVFEDLFSNWEQACLGLGLDAPSREANTLQDGSAAFNYITKWGPADELARAHSKRAKKGGRTPWQLLEDAYMGDLHAGKLFQDFVAAFKGRRQLFWSRGLRDLLGLAEEADDEQAAELGSDGEYQERPTDAVIVTLTWEQWHLVLIHGERANILYMAELGGADLVLFCIRALRKRTVLQDLARVA